MAVYQCKVGSETGEVSTRTVLAESLDEVRREIENKGLFLLSAKQSWLSALASPRRLGFRRIKEQDFLVFNQEFAALVRSGLPILRALDVIVDRVRDGFFKDTLADIRERIKSGYLLSEAFKEKSRLFPPVYSASLLAGERSGNLDAVLRRYMIYQHQALAARRKIRSALIYPSVLFSVAFAIGAVMMVVIIPKFTQVYADFGSNLPPTTIALVSTANFLRDHVWATALTLAALGVAFRAWSQKETGRLTIDRWKFSVPVLGPIWQEFSIAQFARTMATLLSGGIPVVDAMDVAAGAMNNAHMTKQIRKSVQKVREGETLSVSLAATGLFSPMSLEMIQVGETTGSLDHLLNEVSAFYDETVDTRVSTLLALLEPVVLLVMAAIIAFMLLSIYLPMFNLSRVVG
ncbi:MAG: type II secretion system F family protein [Acidobacteria bacterium]|nr:type II secretion system F family protein [Acidobacteriota bacterium]